MDFKTDLHCAVIDQVNAFMSASVNKNKSFMDRYLHDDFLFTTPRGTVFDVDSFLTDFIDNSKLVIELFELIEHKVNLVYGIAVFTGVIRIRFAGEAERYERMTVVLIPAGSRWIIVNIHGSFIPKP